MNNINLNELQEINGGGGPIANTINATVGSVGIANSIAIGALAGPAWGVVAVVGGGYCIYNAVKK